jgi:hypothetical protein
MAMMKITDAARTKEVHIPLELAQSVGVFKDMVESITDGGPEPV